MPLQSAHAENVVAARSAVHTQVKELQDAAAKRMERYANKKRREADLHPGQRVWLSTANLPLVVGARKLAAKWTGPFTILEAVTREAFRLELPPQMRIHPVFHSSQLKPTLGAPRRQAPIQLAGDTEEEFEVDAVLAERLTRGKK